MTLFDRMLSDLPFTRSELSLLVETAPKRYKQHFIQKRNNRGRRLISQPTAEVKLIQRWIIQTFFDDLPVHEAATAYVTGKGILDHASPHSHAKYLLKLDFKDFFPSIKATDFVRHVRQFSELNHADAEMMARLLFHRHPDYTTLRLSIGAPSSPAVSNTIMYGFDKRVSLFCAARGITYTRYADDLALSTSAPHTLDKVHEFVRATCSQIVYPDLHLNDDKTVFSSKKFARRLTGLTLANDGKVSLGRARKHLIRAMTHRASMNQLNVEELNHLKGLLAFAYSIEPDFVESLKRMIGEDRLLLLFPLGGDVTGP